jgi:riboflavin synthase
MFTGLIEETGVITRIEPTAQSIRLVIASQVCARGTRVGDSIAVNGACLTVVKRQKVRSQTHLHFDLLNETWTRTSLHLARVGSAVNLERALAAKARLGGHFVTGHVDGLGSITRWEASGKDHVLEIQTPRELRGHLVTKGSITVDGISLTVAAVTRTGFRVWIIPHTLEVTALRERKTGDSVNLETDLLGKYVERFLSLRSKKTGPTVRSSRR